MKLAVFIDADNISAKYAEVIMSVVERFGEPITRRAYGNPSVFAGADGWKEAVRQYAIDARMPVNNVDRKNISDFALIIDAMDCLYSGRYDGFVIVSCDSDFTSLAIRLRDADKAVYGIGDDRACQSFKAACTTFVVLPKVIPVALEPATPALANAIPQPPAKPKVPKATKSPPPQTLIAGKDPNEFFSIATNLRFSKATTRKSLKAVMKNQRWTDTEADQIIQEMQRLGILDITSQNKIAWCTDKKLKSLQQQYTKA